MFLCFMLFSSFPSAISFQKTHLKFFYLQCILLKLINLLQHICVSVKDKNNILNNNHEIMKKICLILVFNKLSQNSKKQIILKLKIVFLTGVWVRLASRSFSPNFSTSAFSSVSCFFRLTICSSSASLNANCFCRCCTMT